MTYKARNPRQMNELIQIYEKTGVQKVIAIDVETTGTNPETDYIVEFAAIRYELREKKLNYVSEIDIYIKPPVEMSEDIISIHHISNEFLADKPTEREVFQTILDFIGYAPILLGYNVSFDKQFLSKMCLRNSIQFNSLADLDVLDMARDLIDISETSNFKLSSIANLYGVDRNLTFHNALDDVKATGRLVNVFYDEYMKLSKSINIESQERIIINSVYFWKGFNKMQNGLYVKSNLGKLWLSTLYKCWISSEIDLSCVNIACLEEDIIVRTGLPMEELFKMTNHKFEKLKQKKGGYV